MIQKISILVLSCLSILLPAQENKIIDKIIAKVGSEIILYSDWQDQIAYIKEKQTYLSPDDECAILENILLQKFMIHQAKVDSVEVKEDEVDQQLNARIDQILLYMNNDFEKFREYYGQTVSEVKIKMREELQNQLLVERLQTKITGEIQVTPDEVKSFFLSLPKDSLPYFNSEVEIAEILYKPKFNELQINQAKEKSQKILMRLKNGEDFAKLANTLSDDPGSARLGGSLGWMKRGSLVPEFEAAAYNLEKDSISGIVESEFGLHIIQLLGRRGNSILTRHILVKPRLEEEDYKKTELFLDSIRAKILKDSIPFPTAVKIYSDPKSESYTNSGILINPKTGNNNFEIGDLEPDIYFAIDNLKIGDLSKVFASTDQEGKKYYRIIKLHSRTDPHKANLQQDYAKIQTAAKELKKNEQFRIWIDSKLPTVYVEIDAVIKTICPSLVSFGSGMIK
ncbi:MAG: peptidylprolyl isomerase [Bacteroidota bacterium]|nr:peptidylprolyl isomerase [Bacteroidota bacterium]